MALNFKDMVGIIKNTVFVDEFTSKLGDDDEMIVLSFFVRNQQAAYDLVRWFEIGYEYILDADITPGEVIPNRYLVFVEIKRRTTFLKQLKELLSDLGTLTEFKLSDWKITFDGQTIQYDVEKLYNGLFLSPHEYRLDHESELNDLRTQANLPVKSTLKNVDNDIKQIQAQAGVI